MAWITRTTLFTRTTQAMTAAALMAPKHPRAQENPMTNNMPPSRLYLGLAAGAVAVAALLVTAPVATAQSEQQIKSNCANIGGWYDTFTAGGVRYSACCFRDLNGTTHCEFFEDGAFKGQEYWPREATPDPLPIRKPLGPAPITQPGQSQPPAPPKPGAPISTLPQQGREQGPGAPITPVPVGPGTGRG